MRIATIGAGYVGLVTGVCLAEFGHDVVCVEANPSRLAALRQGKVPIFEPGLDVLLTNNVVADRLHFTDDLSSAVGAADVVIIAVGTPTKHGDGRADLGQVYDAARLIAPALKGHTAIVTKSTVPVGTGDEIESIIAALSPEADFDVISNPEFLREGAAIEDFKHPDRIIVGVESDRAKETMREVYGPLFSGPSPIVFVSRRTSELTKYAANSFLAMKITFINEMADLCEAVGADVQHVARGIGLDPRIGERFLNAGPGYGGSCFPKDTLALAKTAQDAGVAVRLVETTIEVNSARKRAMSRKIMDAVGGNVAGKNVALLGLTFKPNTDDMRDAPSIDIIHALQGAGASIRAFDPHGMEAAAAMFSGVHYAIGPYDAAASADVVVIVTEWDEFRALDLDRLKAQMNVPIFVDLRNVYRPSDVVRHGFTYHGIGRTLSMSPAERALYTSGD